jgi:hypothetical protein
MKILNTKMQIHAFIQHNNFIKNRKEKKKVSKFSYQEHTNQTSDQAPGEPINSLYKSKLKTSTVSSKPKRNKTHMLEIKICVNNTVPAWERENKRRLIRHPRGPPLLGLHRLPT